MIRDELVAELQRRLGTANRALITRAEHYAPESASEDSAFHTALLANINADAGVITHWRPQLERWPKSTRTPHECAPD